MQPFVYINYKKLVFININDLKNILNFFLI